MTDEESPGICPIMTRSGSSRNMYFCHNGYPSMDREIPMDTECMAWEPPEYYCGIRDMCEDCDTGLCGLNDGACQKSKKVESKPGYCRMIPQTGVR